VKFVDEFRDPVQAQRYVQALHALCNRPWTLMEVCGGQTHNLLKFGIDQLLPPCITLLHGPGCPVCVTAAETIDDAIALAQRPEVVLCSFGDMLRVPGTAGDLLSAKAQGADVRAVYSPLDALSLARREPERQIVFFAIGFETTVPTTALAVLQAAASGVENFSLLTSHRRVPPAMEAILSGPASTVQGFLAAGHVCAVTGYAEYVPIARRYQMPIVVTGFEPLDLLAGIYACVRQLEIGRAEVENQYRRAVQREGNREARRVIAAVFEVGPQQWRGIGELADSGLRLRAEFSAFDALQRWPEQLVTRHASAPMSECMSGAVLQGQKRPTECPAFGGRCTPEHPLGATMVSSEGACSAYYRYRHAVPDCSTQVS
jgi:hydrogenase expression/formation protein HypD